MRTTQQLRDDVYAIWKAGVDGVDVDRLVRNNVAFDIRSKTLEIASVPYPLVGIDRIVVVGGGKASGRMAESLESVLGPLLDIEGELNVPKIDGWINVPIGCELLLRKIKVFPARPMGLNEPTEAAAAGTREIISLLRSLTPRDLCLCLISGGGSALLPAPPPEISLHDKIEITRFLSGTGADIQELNAVRKQISLLKGGGMKKLCEGRRLVSLILSDVLGDPLDVIASGPTVDNASGPRDALHVLEKFVDHSATESQRTAVQNIVRYLRNRAETEPTPGNGKPTGPLTVDQYGAIMDSQGGSVRCVIIGNNPLAVDSAGIEAVHRGYSYLLTSATCSEGFAEDLGVQLAEEAIRMKSSGPDCIVSGGEPVVKLAPKEIRGKGGRNQQLILAALIRLLKGTEFTQNEPLGIAMLSGGTDGEDGPTDAAGARIDDEFVQKLRNRLAADPTFSMEKFLETNDAYSFFETLDGLVKTGPTGTNVCDLRVVLVDRIAQTHG